jgi:hypothetical protein
MYKGDILVGRGGVYELSRPIHTLTVCPVTPRFEYERFNELIHVREYFHLRM